MLVSSVKSYPYARVRKILVRRGGTWGAESSSEKVVVIRTSK